MQQRLVDLLDKIGNEEVTSEWKFVDMVDQISDQWDFRWMMGGIDKIPDYKTGWYWDKYKN